MFEHIDKKNLHHAYLIEGSREAVLPEILKFIESLGVVTTGSSDFTHIHLDTFKVEDARSLKALGGEKGYTEKKKIFLLSTNSFLLEAQNTLLKLFEEPIENTHFFLVMPDKNSLLPTFISRFQLISAKEKNNSAENIAEKFLKMNLPTRIEFVKDLLVEEEEKDDEGREILQENSARSNALIFLNNLEAALHKDLKDISPAVFEHILKVRKFLRMPGSSTKTLLEGVALVTPQL
jgi:DNA polymerase III delta prime subunit